MTMTQERITALIGKVQGPWVWIGNFEEPTVEVYGTDKFVLRVELATTPSIDDRFETLTLGPESDFRLPRANFVRMALVQTEARMPICKIRSR